MQRRNFLKTAAVAAGTMAMMPAVASSSMLKPAKGETIPKGAVTLYIEFRIMPNFKDDLLDKVNQYNKVLAKTKGFLSLSLKNMVGDSTMVHNYDTKLKGVLSSAYFDASKEGSMPLFYSLFIRFENYHDLMASKTTEWFSKVISKYGPLSKNYSEGVYKTVSAGDREHIYTSQSDIEKFLKNQQDKPTNRYITVNNHVGIFTKDVNAFNKKSTSLLKVAQNTFRPAKGDYDYNPKFPKGIPGSYQNLHYRRAISTEILQSAFSDGDKTHYLFHGTWESVYDHENSHTDPRFRADVMKIFPYIVEGPVEPFYETIILNNKA
ncbi:twin-arginine translocation signal domain-containing protein [Sulfurimonas autotrophica]|uniref:Twin-arginine translocation signal domain-containing protein n=1 Tax=Sulfurimonas autotrophica (strain ATCC BAA-671 / DSM 16294 / JCM 11897 / OK10) TaxID=563040 RepID=E0UP78_SULAO|nr:twin-arginine translocation signal domain-containing protein [Sulfurimonas autotrophica]ADN08542.1 hypothetical protein Saut_0493 [Sulfurimonas autotrophica DSM 16294]